MRVSWLVVLRVTVGFPECLAVPGSVQQGGRDTSGAAGQQQLPVDHQSTQQTVPEPGAEPGALPPHRVLDRPEVSQHPDLPQMTLLLLLHLLPLYLLLCLLLLLHLLLLGLLLYKVAPGPECGALPPHQVLDHPEVQQPDLLLLLLLLLLLYLLLLLLLVVFYYYRQKKSPKNKR